MDKQKAMEQMNEYEKELSILNTEHGKEIDILSEEYEKEIEKERVIIVSVYEKARDKFFCEKSTLLTEEEFEKVTILVDEKLEKAYAFLCEKLEKAFAFLDEKLEKAMTSLKEKYAEAISFRKKSLKDYLVNTLLEIQKSELESFTEEYLRYQTKSELKGFEKLTKTELIIFCLNIEKLILNKLKKNELEKILFNHIEQNSL